MTPKFIKVGADIYLKGRFGKLVYIYEVDPTVGRVVFEDGMVEDVPLWQLSEVIT